MGLHRAPSKERVTDDGDGDGLDAPFTLPERAKLSARPPPMSPTRVGTLLGRPNPAPTPAPKWGEIEVTGSSPTLREHVEAIDPAAHVIAPPQPPTTAVSAPPGFGGQTAAPIEPPKPSRPPAAAIPKDSRAWGEVDLLGVSSNIGAAVSLDSSRPPPPGALDTNETLRDGPPRDMPPRDMPTGDMPMGAPLHEAAPNAVRVSALPPMPEGKTYYCETCRAYVPPDRALAMSTQEGRVALPICPTCRRFVRLESSTSVRGLDVVLLEAITWPISREMLPTLLGNALVFWLFTSCWVIGIAPLTIGGLATGLGVLATYGAAIIRSTADGEDRPPPPSEAIGSWSIASAVIRHSLVFVLGGLPLGYAIVSGALGDWSPTERTVLIVLGIVVFCLYVPAGQIVASKRETFFAALNPIIPIRFAYRVGSGYLLACAILFGFALAHLVAIGVVMGVAGTIVGPGVIWGLCVAPVVVLGVFIEARMLGLLVREHRFDLALV